MTFLSVLKPIQSAVNSTSTPLGAGETFTGETEDALNFQSLNISITSDQDSAANGLIVEFSTDGTNYNNFTSITFQANDQLFETVNIKAKWFRIRYTNGSIPQTIFRLFITLYPYQFKQSEGVIIKNSESIFEELAVVQRTPIIELKSTYGISELRDNIVTSGDGTVSNIVAGAGGTGEYLLNSSTIDGVASLSSQEAGRYQAGFSAIVGIGVRVPNSNNYYGDQEILWGLGTTDIGFFFGVDATGIFTSIKRSGEAIVKTYQDDWNNDTLNGLGPSKETLYLSFGNIYQIEFSWYGYGVVEYVIYQNPVLQGLTASKIIVNRVRVTGSTSIQNPNLPIFAQIANNGTVGNLDMFVAGRQYSIQGLYNPNRRVTAERRIGVTVTNATYVPLVTFRKKTDYSTVSVKVSGYEIISDIDLILEIRLNAIISGGVTTYATPTNTSASETAMEVNNGATNMVVDPSTTGGELLWSGLIYGGSGKGNTSSFSSGEVLDYDIPGTATLSFGVISLGANATVTGIFRVREDW